MRLLKHENLEDITRIKVCENVGVIFCETFGAWGFQMEKLWNSVQISLDKSFKPFAFEIQVVFVCFVDFPGKV